MVKKLKEIFLTNTIRQYAQYIKNRKGLKNLLKKESLRSKIQRQFPKNIAIIFIGTRDYIKFFPEYYENIKKLFLPNTPKKFFIFTDRVNEPSLSNKRDVEVVPIVHEKYPLTMLRAYEHMDKINKKLDGYDWIIWIDADIKVNMKITEKEFFSHNKPLFAVRHPNFINRVGTFEFNPKSLASVKKTDDLSVYVQACFWGGKNNEVLRLVKVLKNRIKIDLDNNIIARFCDESHLNKYFIENKDKFFIYDPSYAYPDKRPIPNPFKKKILHVYTKKFKIFK